MSTGLPAYDNGVSNISIVTIAKEIKEIHSEDIALIKSGNFYKVYGKDAYIISNLFKYAIKEKEGVPLVVLQK